MEGIIILLLIVLLIMIVRLMDRVDRIETRVRKLNDQLGDGAATERIMSKPAKPIAPPTSKPEQPPISKPVEPPVKKEEEKVKEVEKPIVAASQTRNIAPVTTPRAKTVKPPRPSFWERNPDLEKFIGENLLSKIGIVIFVIGMGFLVKLGIDNEVITPPMRVAIGVLIGGGMIALAHYMRTSFARFSSILIGGALAVLYFTIALAFHEYELLPQTAAFIIMVVITSFGVLLSIAYDRKELAVLALIGGFGTPFFVSTGSGNYIALLTYLIILDIGMLALVYFKKWNIINYLAYSFTYILFMAVYFTRFIEDPDATRMPLFMFLTAFYLIFFLMTIVYNVRNRQKFGFPEIGMLLTNSALYFGLGLGLTQSYQEGFYSGLFTALVAVFNFGFAFTLFKRKEIDKNLLFVLIGLVLTFVSLIAPIQLDGNYITLFWSIEAVLLLWLANKSGIQLMKASAVIITILMLISLGMDWQQNYFPRYDYVILSIFLNKAFVASFVAIASLVGSMVLLREEEPLQVWSFNIDWKKKYNGIALAIVFYFGFFFELNYQFRHFEFSESLRLILLGIYNFTYVLLIIAAYRVRPVPLMQKAGFWLSVIAGLSYMTVYLRQTANARSYGLLESGVETGFYWHYVLLILFILIMIHIYRYIRKEYTFQSRFGQMSLWVLAFVGVYVCSAEVSHLSMLYQFGTGRSDAEAFNIAVRSVFPVVWALSAFVLMVAGMKLKMKPLRLSSLVLFSVTILKLFFYDLAGNSTGKIISFILLGVILLLISFLYQKLKFIIEDDAKKD